MLFNTNILTVSNGYTIPYFTKAYLSFEINDLQTTSYLNYKLSPYDTLLRIHYLIYKDIFDTTYLIIMFLVRLFANFNQKNLNMTKTLIIYINTIDIDPIIIIIVVNRGGSIHKSKREHYTYRYDLLLAFMCVNKEKCPLWEQFTINY